MQLSPEQLLSALEQYIELPETRRRLTAEQVSWFTNPENGFLLIYACLTASAEMVADIGDNIGPWLEIAISEMSLSLNKMPPECKVEMEQAITRLLGHAKQEGVLNREWLFIILAILKRNQFSLDVDMDDFLSNDTAGSSRPFAVTFDHQELPDIQNMLAQAEVNNGLDFVEFFQQGLSLLPVDALPLFFKQVLDCPFGIDGLLLLTQYFDEAVAKACAQVLSDCHASSWERLTQPQLLTLCTRFNRHPDIGSHFKHWQKHVLRYCRPQREALLHGLYVSMVDGVDCANMLIDVSLGEDRTKLAMMFYLTTGIQESLLGLAPGCTLEELVTKTAEEIEIHKLKPEWLALVLPGILAIHRENDTPLDMASLYWLAHLPPQWTQPQAFELSAWGEALGFKADYRRQELNRMSIYALGETVFSWLAPQEYMAEAKAPRELRKRYFLPHKVQFQRRLSYCAAIEHFRESGNKRSEQAYLDMALVFDEPNIQRKKFALLDTLAELSFETYLQHCQAFMPEPMGLVLKLQLQGVRPVIWRRIQLNNQLSLNELHQVIQASMGWENGHLYLFADERQAIDQEHYDDIRIGHLLKEPGDTLSYIYDFGDNWEHSLVLEKCLDIPSSMPKVTAGKGLCPVEDCGGSWGWSQLLRLHKRPNLDEEELEQLSWYGLSQLEPLPVFDKAESNKRLAELFSS